MTTDTITQTPTVYFLDDFVVRIDYNAVGTTEEGTIPFRWRSGWFDLGYPGYVKELKKIYIYYDWPDNTAGNLNVDFESLGMKNGIPGETNEFDIDVEENPDYYIEYFIGGKMIGELFRIDITETSLIPLKIEKIIITYDVSPLI